MSKQESMDAESRWRKKRRKDVSDAHRRSGLCAAAKSPAVVRRAPSTRVRQDSAAPPVRRETYRVNKEPSGRLALWHMYDRRNEKNRTKTYLSTGE